MPQRRGRALAMALLVWAGGSPPASADRPAPDLAAGKAAYQQSCARCHGATGRGDGLDAKRFFPRPRDLTLGVYKFRSTVSGTPPTDEDLFRSVTHGLSGSNMPDWRHLDEPTRWQLVEYLKTLSPVFEQVKPEPVSLAGDPGPKRADLVKGRAVYALLGCAACHGETGRANGMSAATLVDDWGMPIRPANLAQGWSYRGGASSQAILTRLLAGIDGAGMPSYAEAISSEEAWHLAYYVASLQEPAQWNLIAHPLKLTGAPPSALDDPRWEEAERTDVRLRDVVDATGTWQAPPTVTAVSFTAIATEEAITFQFTWDDPTQETGSPADAFALLLKPEGSRGDVVTLQAWPYEGAPALDVCYWTAAQPTQAVERVVSDFRELTAPATKRPILPSAAAYHDGRWQLTLQRSHPPASREGVARVDPEGFTSIAFVVWDGGNPGAARAVSPWVELSLQP